MKKPLADSYEFQERAAIRQFDGNYDGLAANQLALMDLNEREQQKAEKEGPKIDVPALPKELCQDKQETETIEQIRQQRDEVKRSWLSEIDMAKQAELAAKWQELSMEIIELRKGT